MHSQMFLNLPVKNLPRSRAFFKNMGYSFDEQFSNEQGACLVLGEHSFGMPLTKDSCTSTAFMTSTAMCGKCFGWTRTQRRQPDNIFYIVLPVSQRF